VKKDFLEKKPYYYFKVLMDDVSPIYEPEKILLFIDSRFWATPRPKSQLNLIAIPSHSAGQKINTKLQSRSMARVLKKQAFRILLSTSAGLQDGLFSNQKSQFVLILEGLRLENVDTFNGHLELF
jgi:hypothetical protein